MILRLAPAVLLLALAATPLLAADPPNAEAFLIAGKLADGERELNNYLREHPTDDGARFGLGTLQFVRSVEHLSQSLYQFGALGGQTTLARQMPLLRLPVPENPKPDKVRYADVRRMLQNMVDDLAKVEDSLAQVKDKRVKLPLHFAQIRLDIDGNGKTEDHEVLWKLYAQINRGARLEETEAFAKEFVIGFDYGDVLWLRGYCHLLSAMCETALLYDEQTLFDAVADQIFANPDVPQFPPELLREGERWEDQIADAIAAIHLARFPVKEPQRGEAVLKHLEQVVVLSRQSWLAIGAETDDDHEWVPNPKQSGVIPGVRVTPEMIAGWHEFLNEFEAILQGKKLLMHWRLAGTHGINMRKVFLEPREFDLVMWAHGAAAIPYLQEGECSQPETWNRFNRVFRGEFIGFAIWFN